MASPGLSSFILKSGRPPTHALNKSRRTHFQIFPSPARASPLSKSTAAARNGSDGISRPRARSSAMYKSWISSRVFPDEAPRAALNASFRAWERRHDSDSYVSRYSSHPGRKSPGSPCDVRWCSRPGQAQRRCQTVTGTASFLPARGHAPWHQQRHSMTEDSARRPGTAGLAKRTWPHAWCAALVHARDLPVAVSPALALDTMNLLTARDLSAGGTPGDMTAAHPTSMTHMTPLSVPLRCG